VSWRKLDGEILAKLNTEVLGDDPERMVCLPLDQLGALIFRHLQKQKTAKFLFRHEVLALGQDDHKPWIEVKTPEETKTLEADYTISCDGANSKIRRALFGDWDFPGLTWDRQIVATNVCFPTQPVTCISYS
jgi:2-polyprenyl-6-methoxyphenol hydroxylase-like FAD-dependent oxidoreductase